MICSIGTMNNTPAAGSGGPGIIADCFAKQSCTARLHSESASYKHPFRGFPPLCSPGSVGLERTSFCSPDTSAPAPCGTHLSGDRTGPPGFLVSPQRDRGGTCLLSCPEGLFPRLHFEEGNTQHSSFVA